MNSPSEENKGIYISNILKLVSSFVIHFEDVADQMHHRHVSLYGNYFNGDMDKEEMVYYNHLAGEYTVIDEMMYITSLSTGEVIELTKAQMEIHQSTKLNLQKNKTSINNLIAKYPSKETLIRGIINPIDINISTTAENGEILSYDSSLIEGQEFSLIERVQEYIYVYMHKWNIPQYMNVDKYYLSVFISSLVANLVPVVINLREDVLHTQEAHSFHINEYLISRGVLPDRLFYLNLEQKTYLYRNFEYIRKNVGSRKVFNGLLLNFVTPAKIPLDGYRFRLSHAESGSSLPRFLSDNLIEGLRSNSEEVKDLEKYMELEVNYRASNAIVDYDETYSEVEYSRYSNIKTKMLESSMTSMSSGHIVSEDRLAISLWGVTSNTYGSVPRYATPVNFLRPDGISITLEPDVAFTLYMLLDILIYGTTPTVVPNTVTVGHTMYEGVISSSMWSGYGLSEELYNYINFLRPVLNTSTANKTSIDSDSADIYNYYTKTLSYIHSMWNKMEKSMALLLMKDLFPRKTIPLTGRGESIDSWLKTNVGIDYNSMDSYELYNLMNVVGGEFAGVSVEITGDLNVQKATIETLMSISSYSICCSYSTAPGKLINIDVGTGTEIVFEIEEVDLEPLDIHLNLPANQVVVARLDPVEAIPLDGLNVIIELPANQVADIKLEQITGEKVPVTVKDGHSPLKYTGSLEAKIDSKYKNVKILWVQTSGVPVTFTSPLTGLVIEFTANDLDRKEFTVYTSKGTIYEEFAVAQFYHYPISHIDHTALTHESKMDVKGYLSDEDLELTATRAMLPYDPSVVNYSNVAVKVNSLIGSDKSPFDTNTELNVSNRQLEATRHLVLQSYLEKESGGAWSTIQSTAGYVDRFIGYPDVGTTTRVRYLVNTYGMEYYVSTILTDEVLGGMSEAFTNAGPKISVKMDNFVVRQSIKFRNVRVDEVKIIGNVSSAKLSNLVIIESKLTNETEEEEIVHGRSASSVKVENFVSFASSKIGIT